MNLKKAVEAQQRLSARLNLKWDGKEVNLMAGADFGYSYKKNKIGASIVVFKIPELEIVEISEAVREIEFPYLPGFLSFREGPVFLDAFKKIRSKPDVTLVDGNGIAHPRKMGLASYVGVILDICTIGCAKTPFFPFVLPSESRGSYTFFRNDKKDKAGICLRTRPGVKPIFVSPGHRIDFMSAMKLVLRCSKFRIPEPLREAHRRASKIF
ncbi:MAG: endonuclease V [Candidatus Aminicenantes bacterium]|nr:endonuclease V [Candidatus Aminicenantes bacterium]